MSKEKESSPDFMLRGQLLIAMPGMDDSRFARTVVLICAHSEEGSMGFILNQPAAKPTFPEVLAELKLDVQKDYLTKMDKHVPIFRGGPVEQGRGFVIHSLDYGIGATTKVGNFGGLTGTLDILRAISSPNPPEKSIMLLGYAGWAEGQLEEEISQNGWLTVPATKELVFDNHHEMIYEAALATLGVSEAALSSNSGHA